MVKQKYYRFISFFQYVLLFVVMGSMLLSCHKREGSAALNFWDDVDFSLKDTGAQKELLDSLLVDFIILLDEAPPRDVNKAIYRAMTKGKENPFTFQYFIKQFDYHLYSPNSVLRNDLYYEEVLKYIVSSNGINLTDKVRYKNRLELVVQNQKGKKANNFTYLQSTGLERDLYSLKNTCKIIVFYDPYCNTCRNMLSKLELMNRVLKRSRKKKVKILTVCAVGEESDWRGYEAEFPRSWINGYNKEEEIIRNNLYDLKAFPTFYLIDEDNRVLLKDTDIKHVKDYISSWT
ncbi:DUF5106 domain-containing protein [Sphingobacterium tabacisoli]|uniref:DUF5106 domain-containing protein n=1 Tax=Sphingobacterium tabacisoli TaxID=2044855 RepID=A0ABW5LAT8_9SPHI|nr:DUF5106 domain-containing protein [Sphingobacterium tabacisoli]